MKLRNFKTKIVYTKLCNLKSEIHSPIEFILSLILCLLNIVDKCRDMPSFNEIVTNFLRHTLNKKIFVASDCLKFVANNQHVSYVPRNMANYLASQYPKILTRVFASFKSFGSFHVFSVEKLISKRAVFEILII